MARTGQFRQQISKPKSLPPEAHTWWWHPSRTGVPMGPSFVRRHIHEVDPNVELTLNRYTGNWQVWMKKPSIQTKVCWGWQLLFTVPPDQLGEGEAILARLFEASGRKWGSARRYFDAIEREYWRDREQTERHDKSEAMAAAMEVFDYSQIKNIGSGSKFSTYHS